MQGVFQNQICQMFDYLRLTSGKPLFILRQVCLIIPYTTNI